MNIFIHHPLRLLEGGFLGFRSNPSCGLKEYGFRLDLTTQISYYSYDYGYGFTFRVLGFGIGAIWC